MAWCKDGLKFLVFVLHGNWNFVPLFFVHSNSDHRFALTVRVLFLVLLLRGNLDFGCGSALRALVS